MWIQIIDDHPFIDHIDVIERSRAEIQEARKRLWDKFIAEELGKPKEPTVIAQDAIEWEI